MGATLTTARVGETMEANGDFWSTYGWHPRSACAAAATLDVFEERGEELFANATTLGAHARERLTFMPFTSEVNVRGVGYDFTAPFRREAFELRRAPQLHVK